MLSLANLTSRSLRRPGAPFQACPAGSAMAAARQYAASMATFDEVAAMALGLPEATESERRGTRTWFVGTKGFAWERPFSKADLRRFGDAAPPGGPILAVRVEDLGEKDAVLAAPPAGFFTIPHFDGYAAVLIELDRVPEQALREAITDAWLACAPARLAAGFLRRSQGAGGRTGQRPSPAG
jgi:hypothetical protein